LTAAAGTYVSTTLLTDLRNEARAAVGEDAAGWDLEVDAEDALTLNLRYPVSLEAADYDAFRYLRPVVRIGPIAQAADGA
jgi:hypothetical protein